MSAELNLQITDIEHQVSSLQQELNGFSRDFQMVVHLYHQEAFTDEQMAQILEAAHLPFLPDEIIPPKIPVLNGKEPTEKEKAIISELTEFWDKTDELLHPNAYQRLDIDKIKTARTRSLLEQMRERAELQQIFSRSEFAKMGCRSELESGLLEPIEAEEEIPGILIKANQELDSQGLLIDTDLEIALAEKRPELYWLAEKKDG